MSQRQRTLSKYLSFVLRHGAVELGLSMDPEGFVPLEDVWALVQKNLRSHRFKLHELDVLLAPTREGAGRFERKGELIRARYGHNRAVAEILYPECAPPPVLFHGTDRQACVKIQEQGLLPMSRQFVHLSTTEQRALVVARRHSNEPILLQIMAMEAMQAGVRFFHPEPEHFLVERVPPEFVIFHPQS